jgi:chloramphenicol 3-O-phosphotransferase
VRSPCGPIFLIAGTPGSGKTSVARELMQRYPFGLHIPLDDLRDWVVSGLAPPVPEWTEETTRQFALARHAAACTARLYADAGFAVAIDDVLFPVEAEVLFGEAFRGCAFHRVALRPSVEVALARNAARMTKPFDPAFLTATIRDLDQEMTTQPFAEYGWLVLDTSNLSVEESVDVILSPDW